MRQRLMVSLALIVMHSRVTYAGTCEHMQKWKRVELLYGSIHTLHYKSLLENPQRIDVNCIL